MDTQNDSTTRTTNRNDSLRILAQVAARLTDDVIAIRLDTDGLVIHVRTLEHANELSYLLAANAVEIKDGTYIQPWNGAEWASKRTTWTNTQDRVSVLLIEQTRTGRTREVCCEQGICADPVGPRAEVVA